MNAIRTTASYESPAPLGRRACSAFRFPVAWACLAVCLALSGCARMVQFVPVHAEDNGNILQNPRFEQGEGVPAGWTFPRDAAPKGTLSLPASARSGRILRLSPNARNAPYDLKRSPLGVGQAWPARSFLG